MRRPWNGRIGPDTKQVRGLVIEAHRLERSDKAARSPAGNRAGLFANGAWQRARQGMREQLADAEHVPRDQCTTE